MTYGYSTQYAPLQLCGPYGDECKQGTYGTGVPTLAEMKERLAKRDANAARFRELKLQ